MNAILYKMKADYLRYIYECLAGEDGLLVSSTNENNFKFFNTPENFNDDLETKQQREINIEEGDIDCIICNPNFLAD